MKNSFAFTLFGQTCLFIALLLGGCTKENDPDPARPACRIIKASSVSGSSTTTTRYTYDNAHRLTESVTENETRTQSNSNYAYNQKGQLGTLTSQTYLYDAASNATVTTRTYTFEYNEKGQVSGYQLITASSNPAMPTTISTITYEYDSQGNRTKSTTQSGSGATSVESYEYQDGNCIKTTYRVGESGEFTVAYEYYLDQEFKSRTMAHIGVFGPSASRHMLKKSTQPPAGASGTIFFSERSYEYNDKGFPVKTTFTNASSSGTIFTSVSTNEYACP